MKIRKLTAVGILMIVLGAIFLYRTELVTFYMNTFLNPNREASIDSSDETNIIPVQITSMYKVQITLHRQVNRI